MQKVDIDTLPFIASRDGKALPKPDPAKHEFPRAFWHVSPTGDYAADSRTGHRYALDYLRYEETNRDGGGILINIVNEMPRPLGGIEVGFLTLVCAAASVGAYEARRIAAFWESQP